MTAAYGKQRQSHIFKKANKTGTRRHIEILATMAVHGAWEPSRTHSEADKKARSNAFKPNSKRSSRYQATPSE
jgi:hypothetical protein